jgi:hypothetical protein
MIKWNDNLWIFTIDEFNKLPDGIELTSVNGGKVIKGVDYVDLDTRGKYIAFGIENPLLHKEAELFSIFMLS